MIFQMDFEINEKDKQDQDYENKIYQKFCTNYINQIRDKLNFEKENLTIDDPRNQLENNKESKNKTPKKIDIIRFRMEMVVVKTHLKNKIKKKNDRPSFDNLNIKMENGG
jgi:hypothetical protein